MSQMSNYLEGKLVEHTLRAVAYTAPAAVYAALYLSDPGETDAGTEVTGTNYARQAVTFGAHANGQVANALVTFGVAGAGGWGTITHFGIRDALTAGNLLVYGALTASVTVNENDQVKFNAGDLTVTFA